MDQHEYPPGFIEQTVPGAYQTLHTHMEIFLTPEKNDTPELLHKKRDVLQRIIEEAMTISGAITDRLIELQDIDVQLNP